jgi:hypothetical protein
MVATVMSFGAFLSISTLWLAMASFYIVAGKDLLPG